MQQFSMDFGALEIDFLLVFLDFFMCLFILRNELLHSLRERMVLELVAFPLF